MASDADTERLAALRLAGKGNFSGAIAVLRRVVEASNEPEDRFQLGAMAYLVNDFGEAQAQLERAYRDFQSRGLPRRAAMAATMLGRVHCDLFDDKVVGRAWLARALRLLDHEEPCVEKGYVLVGLFAAYVESADELEARASMALSIAHRFQDRDLECKALGDSGLALVSMGRVRAGMARLDEAFTMILGGDCRDPAVINQVACGLISACERCGDVTRAEAWLRFIENSASSAAEGPAVQLFAHCWSAFGSLLCRVGRWQEAETALRMALAKGEASYRFLRLTTRAALADLWIQQGRLEEATRLIDESIDRVEVMGPRARLYLAQGKYDLAAAVARQALRQLSGDQLRAASLLLVLVEAELGGGETSAAESAALQLQQLAEGAEVPTVAAQAALALGKAAMAREEPELAAQRFEAGLAAIGDSCPPLRAALHLELARAYASTAPAETIVNAEAALSVYQRLGVPEAEQAADLLKAHGRTAPVGASPPTAMDMLSRREQEVLSLLAGGLSNPDIARRLFISPKTTEHHVSSILSKLGLRNRTEAAAFAASFQISQGPEVSSAD
ncbi:MAG TPA: LuxR C-terminal-related transcriptional regulator [Ktedonobacterales bacterium]|jgi:DNA-binding CsgD family transcriptional regulator|nr:LuxR C-terminal-related transcriptional regulator [Ktedonobacterales bacterium]